VSRKKKDKLRVAMIGQKLVPSREGGVEIVVWELAKHLRDMGYEVDCYNRSGYGRSAKSYDRIPGKKGVYKDGIRILTIPTPRNNKLNAIVYSFLATLRALFGGYDVIHYHAEGPCLMLWLPKLLRIRVVATIHGLDWQRAKWGNFASKMLRLGEKIAATYADEVIVLSKNMQEYFWHEYGRDTYYIPNGIDPLPKAPAPGDTLTYYPQIRTGEYILTLSRIVPEKGIHYVIEAFRQLDTDKQLVIAGGPSNAEEYMQQIRDLAAQDDRIIMSGFADAPRVQELMSNAWVYVIPSDVEGMSISLLEAMSCGNCCIVSDIMENLEVVEDKAVRFRRGRPEDLKEKLEHLLRHPEAVEKYRSEASDFICSKYNWKKMTEEIAELYK